ncbi:hypothetical protein ACEYW6_21165 [Nostoc sp. UIC 10607]|uniref:hypothetical protein n=1 Tax=Nostoc sp. UIC 10607 TaxID=3045935 RepID=UPI0039A2BB1C
MKTYLKVEFEVKNSKNVENVEKILYETFKVKFQQIDTQEVESYKDIQVNVGGDLAVGEIVIAVIGLAVAVVDLYKFLKEKELRLEELDVEKAKLELERAKFELEKLSNFERERLRQAFIEEDLPQILQASDVTYTELDTSIYIKE